MHLRGLLNTLAIQSNRDWVWPFWVERQFDPRLKGDAWEKDTTAGQLPNGFCY